MRGYLAIVAMSFKMYWRSRDAVFWGIAFPILLMGLIGIVFAPTDGHFHLTVSVVNDGNGVLNQHVIDALKQVKVFTVVEESEEAGLKALKEGERSLVIVVPDLKTELPHQGDPDNDVGEVSPHRAYEIITYYDQSKDQVAQAGIAVIRGVMTDMNKALTGRADVLTVSTEPIQSKPLGIFDFLLPGVLGMTIMQTGLMGVTWVLTSYRDEGVLKRVLTTSLSAVQFLGGLISRYVIVNLFQAVVIFLVATYIFKATTVGSLFQYALLVLLGSVTFLSIGFAVSAVSKSGESANMLGTLLNFPMMFLSGTFWPKELMPEGIRPLIQAMPLTPLVDAMRGVALQGESMWAYWPGLMYMLFWAVLGLLVAAWRYRWE